MKNLSLLFIMLFMLGFLNGKAQNIGDTAPDFTFNVLDGGTFTLSEQHDKVVMIFVFGYTCHYCINSAPIVEEKLIKPYEGYENFIPIGVDIWDGSTSGVEAFREQTGLDIPLLMMASSFATDYNTIQDRIVVIDQQGKIAYQNNGGAGSVTHQVIPVIDELLGLVTSLRTNSAESPGVTVVPNPVSDRASLNFELGENSEIMISLHSSDGRLIRQIHQGLLNSGMHHMEMDMSALKQGIYFARLQGNGLDKVVRIIKQ